MNKVAVIYYSLEGHTQFVAEKISERLGCPVIRKALSFVKHLPWRTRALISKRMQLSSWQLQSGQEISARLYVRSFRNIGWRKNEYSWSPRIAEVRLRGASPP
jgi:hypothetical protein